MTSALVHRVSLDGDRCTGVDYSVGTDLFPVSCSGEVVLTAGTVASAYPLIGLLGLGLSTSPARGTSLANRIGEGLRRAQATARKEQLGEPAVTAPP